MDHFLPPEHKNKLLERFIPHSLPSLSEAFTRAAHRINIALYWDLNILCQHVFNSEWLFNTEETLNGGIYRFAFMRLFLVFYLKENKMLENVFF